MVHIKGIIGNEKGEVNLLSVIEQINKENTNPLHVLIDSIGGDLDEGISIYNYLKSLDKMVITESINNCASAATVVFMAGSKRIAGCPTMIHNPFTNASGTGDELKKIASFVKSKETEMENLYAQYANIGKDVLSDLMDKETYISPSQAVSIGLATEAKQIALARINSNINKNEVKMSEKKGLGAVIREYFGVKAKNEPTVYSMELATADGGTLTIDREDGIPQVGDKASPNGSHTMPDGKIIIVENDTIIDIIDPDMSAEGGATEEVVDTMETLIEELQTEVEVLKEELVEAKAKAKTNDDLRILNAVRMAGGYEKVFSPKVSAYKPQARANKETKVEASNALRDRIDAIKEQNKQKGV